METKKVPVSKRALVGRINRVLAKDGQVLRISRSKAELSNFGDAYILDASSNSVAAHQVSFKELATELGVLKAYEDYIEE